MLTQVVNAVQRVVPTKSPLESATALKLYTRGGFLIIEGSSIQFTARLGIRPTKIEAESDPDPNTPDADYDIIRAKQFKDFVGALTGELVTLNSRDSGLHVSCGKVKATIRTIKESSDQLALHISEMEDGPGQGINAKELGAALRRVVQAADEISGREFTNGVSFRTDDNGVLTLTATDGFRMAVDSVPYTLTANAIVPTQTINFVCNELNRMDEDQEMLVWVGPTRATFNHETENTSFEVVSSLIAMNFPDMSAFVPTSSKITILLDRQELINAIKPVLAVSTYRRIGIQAEEGKDTITISASNQDGSITSEVQANVKGGAIDMFMNANFTLSVTGVSDGEKIRILLNEPQKAILVKLDDSDRFSYVMMPMVEK